MSPNRLAAGIRNAENQLLAWILVRFESKFSIFVILTIMVFSILFRSSVSSTTLWIPTVLFLSFGFFNERFGAVWIKLLTLFATIFLYYFIYVFYTKRGFTDFGLSLFLVLLPFLVLTLVKINSRPLKVMFLILYILFEMAMCYFGGNDFISLKIFNFFRPLLVFVVYIFESKASLRELSKLEKSIFVFNPMIFICAALNIRVFKEQKQTRRLYILGVKNLLLSYLAAVLWKKLDNSPLLLNPALFFLLSSSRYFLYMGKYAYYFYGLMQICGFNIKNPYDLPFLALNPVDRWSRTSVYTSLWLKNYIFIPAYKYFNSLVIALGVLFLFDTVIHLRNEFFYFGSRLGEPLPGTSLQITLAFFLHFLIMYSYLKFFQKYNADSWINVLFTYLIMCGVYLLRY